MSKNDDVFYMNDSNFNVDFRINLKLMESNWSAYFTQKERINRKKNSHTINKWMLCCIFFSL